jgi:cytidylate kinase
MRVAPVIAITREPGCNGESVARILAHELGLVLYDWEILEKIAKDAQVSERAVATLDGALRSELDEWLADLSGGSSLSSYHYMQSLRRVLFTVASHGNAVILGRGANFLLPPGKKALGLCLVAPLEARVRNVMVELSLSEELARKHIARAERDQRLWVKRNCHADVNDATCYHLVVNTALVAEGMIVRLVKEMIVANE